MPDRLQLPMDQQPKGISNDQIHGTLVRIDLKVKKILYPPYGLVDAFQFIQAPLDQLVQGQLDDPCLGRGFDGNLDDIDTAMVQLILDGRVESVRE